MSLADVKDGFYVVRAVIVHLDGRGIRSGALPAGSYRGTVVEHEVCIAGERRAFKRLSLVQPSRPRDNCWLELQASYSEFVLSFMDFEEALH